MSRIIYRTDNNKHCYNCKFIKFNNGYGICSKKGILVNESNYCIEDWTLK